MSHSRSDLLSIHSRTGAHRDAGGSDRGDAELLSDFKSAIAAVWANDGKNSWPVEINAVTHLFIEPFTRELLDDLGELRSTGSPELEIASKLETASRIVRLILPMVPGMKALGFEIDRQRSQIVDLLELASRLKHGDVLNRDGRNLVLGPEGVERIMIPGSLRAASSADSASIHRLCGVLWAYGEALRLKAHGLCRQFHGPYSHPEIEGEVLVRDYFELRPVDLWKSTAAARVRSIRVVGVYRDLGLSVDIYDNPAISTGGTYRQALTHYALEADGEPLDSAEAAALAIELSDVLLAVTEEIDRVDWRRAAAKYAEIFWASKRRLRAALDRDPGVPSHVLERIAAGELNEASQRMSARDTQRLLRIAF